MLKSTSTNNLFRNDSKSTLKSADPTITDFADSSNYGASPYQSSKLSKSVVQSEYKIKSRVKEGRPPKFVSKGKDSSKKEVEKPPEVIKFASLLSPFSQKEEKIAEEENFGRMSKTTGFQDQPIPKVEKVERRLYESQAFKERKQDVEIKREDSKKKEMLRRSTYSSNQNYQKYSTMKFNDRKQDDRDMKKKELPKRLTSSPIDVKKLSAYERSKMRHGMLPRRTTLEPKLSPGFSKNSKSEEGESGSAAISPYKPRNSSKSPIVERESSKDISSYKRREDYDYDYKASKSPMRESKSPYRYRNRENSKEKVKPNNSRISMMYQENTPSKSKNDSKSPIRAIPRESHKKKYKEEESSYKKNPPKEHNRVSFSRKDEIIEGPKTTPIGNYATRKASPQKENNRRESSPKNKRDSFSKSKSSLNINSKIKELFTDIIRDKENLEFARQELALKPDLCLTDLFNCLDENQREAITFSEFSRILRKLGLKQSRNSKAVTSLFENFDRDRDSLINLKEFRNIFSPGQKEYSILMNCRAEKEIEKGTDIEKVNNKFLTIIF